MKIYGLYFHSPWDGGNGPREDVEMCEDELWLTEGQAKARAQELNDARLKTTNAERAVHRDYSTARVRPLPPLPELTWEEGYFSVEEHDVKGVTDEQVVVARAGCREIVKVHRGRH